MWAVLAMSWLLLLVVQQSPWWWPLVAAYWPYAVLAVGGIVLVRRGG